MSVRENVAYGGKSRADEYLERFRISHLADARTTELSGGERQRVALARALARDPGVLLLDEPLSALDANTRLTVRGELQELLREFGLPTLLVTHDFEDAASLADTLGVLVDGTLRQLASAQEMVANPADGFVASFTGANLLRGTARERQNGLTPVELEGRRRLLDRSGVGQRQRRRLSVGRDRGAGTSRGLRHERDRGHDSLGRPRRQSRACADRPRHRRGDGRVGRAARARPRKDGRRVVQGDGHETLPVRLTQKLRISAAVPITIAGCAAGRSQRSSRTSCGCGRLTQPFVGAPVSSWTKIAEPRPATVGWTLYSTTANC
jgi:ABC-type spermidine/putrescine transport systems, ATPase components